MTFTNHTPINFDNAQEVASWDSYQDFGHHKAFIKHGKMFHLYTSYNSGCTYGSHEPQTERAYIFGCQTKEEMIAFLRKRIADEDSPWVNPLLVDLGDLGDEA